MMIVVTIVLAGALTSQPQRITSGLIRMMDSMVMYGTGQLCDEKVSVVCLFSVHKWYSASVLCFRLRDHGAEARGTCLRVVSSSLR